MLLTLDEKVELGTSNLWFWLKKERKGDKALYVIDLVLEESLYSELRHSFDCKRMRQHDTMRDELVCLFRRKNNSGRNEEYFNLYQS